MERHIAQAGVVAALVAVGYVIFGALTAGDPAHQVQLTLDPAATSWPWESSLQRAAAARINSAEGQSAASDATVVAEEPETITDLIIRSTAPSAGAAASAADAVVEDFLEFDYQLQLEPFVVQRDALQQEIELLESELADQFTAVEEASNDVEIGVRSTRVEGTAALLGGATSELDRVNQAIESVDPRYSIVESAAVHPLQDRLPEAARIFLAILISGWLIQTVRSTRIAG